jgi:hypothetical protein
MKGGTIFRDIKGVYYAMQKDDDVAYQYNLAEAELFNLINPDPASVTANWNQRYVECP